MKYAIIICSIIGIILTSACSKEGGELPTEPVVDEKPEVQITISCDLSSSSHQISDKLIGFNTIYSFYSDDFWTSSGIKSNLVDMKCGFLRWPGGALTNRYHWNNLNGQGWKDNWDPNYNHSNDLPASGFTDLDEYMAICTETGAIPLVGVNLGSGLKYNRVADGIDEAKALVQYCVDKGYGVDYYYLDNEPYHDGANYKMTVDEYIEQIKMYSPAIKSINPNVKIVVNWNKVRKGDTWKIIEQAGADIDVVEVHWYWSWGEVSFPAWKQQMPMSTANQWYNGGSYKEEVEWFYERLKATSFDHIKLASLEWNVGPSPDLASNPTKFQNALMQGEMLMQFMDGGLEMATLWPIFWPDLNNGEEYNANRYLMDPTNNYELSPSFDMYKLLADAMGKTKYKATTQTATIYPLVVGNNDKSEVIVYLLQKGGTDLYTSVKITEYTNCQLDVFNSSDNSLNNGTVAEVDVDYDTESGAYRFELPAYSIARLTLKN